MAQKLLKPSNEPEELSVLEGTLIQRGISLGNQLRVELGLDETELKIAFNPASDLLLAEFVGSSCEYVERNHGGKVSVAPLLVIGKEDLKAWISLQEVWGRTAKNRFVFHSVSLTVYFGYLGEIVKPQIFRAEWPGVRCWNSSGVGFQSPGAGQPHWQFDATATLRTDRDKQRELSLSKLREEALEQDFRPKSGYRDVLQQVRDIEIERMHFASAAPWWRGKSPYDYGFHMNAPKSVLELSNWIVECLIYIKQELGRC